MLDNMPNMRQTVCMESRKKQSPANRAASHVKSHWRDIVKEANAKGEVVVTNYNRPEVVVVSMERYAKLKNDAAARDPLAALRARFDRQLAVLQEPGASQKLQEAFDATPAEIARAANAARRKR
jgi:prevent-host-death family protein